MRPEFYCGVGIENTWMAEHDPKVRPNKRLLDVYLQMRHYEMWQEDLALAADLGINAIRYSVPWYKSNPEPGKYDWDWIAKPIEWLAKRNIVPVIDLIHYGTPLWMENSVLNANFPDRLAEYAHAFAERFRGLIDHFTPFNEPQTSAILSGYVASWPPYLHGIDGWAKISLANARAIVKTSRALRDTIADAVLISADCCWGPPWKEVEARAPSRGVEKKDEDHLLMDYLACSLAYGKVLPDSALGGCLTGVGYTGEDFRWFLDNAEPPDIFGFNYYPFGWPDETPDVNVKRDDIISRVGLVYKVFQLPIYITETSGGRTEDEKVVWIGVMKQLYQMLRQERIPLKGMNWWPLFETIQWFYRDNSNTVEECIEPGGWNNGLYVVEPQPDGVLKRVPTSAVKAYRDAIVNLKKGASKE